MFLNGLTQPLWNTDPTVCFKISMSSVRANILDTFQEKRLTHGNEMFCREVVNLMSLLKAVQCVSEQNLTIFQSVRLCSFSLSGSTKLHELTQPAPQKKWEKSKAALGFWGAYFGLQLQKPLQ